MLNLTPLADKAPLKLNNEQYLKFVHKKTGGWSNCDTQDEWLAKLYYLKDGVKNGKIEKNKFQELEKRLVLNWMGKFL